MNVKNIKLGENNTASVFKVSMCNMIQVSTRCIKLLTPLTALLSDMGGSDDSGDSEEATLGGIPLDKLGDILAKVITDLDPDELIEILFYLLFNANVQTSTGIITIREKDDLDKLADINITDIGIFILEALRFNDFPFLNKVDIDFSSAISKINTIAEDLTSEKK